MFAGPTSSIFVMETGRLVEGASGVEGVGASCLSHEASARARRTAPAVAARWRVSIRKAASSSVAKNRSAADSGPSMSKEEQSRSFPCGPGTSRLRWFSNGGKMARAAQHEEGSDGWTFGGAAGHLGADRKATRFLEGNRGLRQPARDDCPAVGTAGRASGSPASPRQARLDLCLCAGAGYLAGQPSGRKRSPTPRPSHPTLQYCPDPFRLPHPS